MDMIKLVRIQALKSFVMSDIKLGTLTILSGLNGSGKSTLIQAVRMVFSAYENKTPFLKGFGGYEDLKSKNALRNSDILIRLDCEKAEYSLSINNETYHLSDEVIRIKYDYICAARLGPTTSLPVIDYGEKNFSVGAMGEYLVDYFSNFNDLTINKDIFHPSSDSVTLEQQLDAWMSEISPGVKLNFTKIAKHDMSHIEVDTFRSTNTGFGISYALPIVLALLVLSSRNGINTLTNKKAREWMDGRDESLPLLIIENPEAHLHPRGQTAMGELVAKAANAGVQIIVETHSDHFVDGVRIAVKERKINHRDVKLKFFQKGKDGISSVQDINLLNDGSIEEWPDGYFDQMYKNLTKLSS